MTRLISTRTWRNIGTTLPPTRQTFHIAPQSPLSATPWDTRPYVPYKGGTQPQYLAALSFLSALMFLISLLFQGIVSTFRTFYFVLYGGGATGFCSVEYPMSLMYRLSTNATRVRGVWKIDKDLTGGAYRACCNEFYV